MAKKSLRSKIIKSLSPKAISSAIYKVYFNNSLDIRSVKEISSIGELNFFDIDDNVTIVSTATSNRESFERAERSFSKKYDLTY
ncbi:MAG: hypothetical protein IPM42_19685 [Saprospiraceae bacterium]|nr:hypothetical protein [Saprospiraceae bacterium]